MYRFTIRHKCDWLKLAPHAGELHVPLDIPPNHLTCRTGHSLVASRWERITLTRIKDPTPCLYVRAGMLSTRCVSTFPFTASS